MTVDSKVNAKDGVKMKIPITKPYFDECEKSKILEPLETGWLVHGPNVEKFQTMFAEFTHSKYAIATSSCTTALHLGLIALDIKSGDSVIVPSFTYIASANAIEYTGAKPIFCDINPFTFNIDETKLKDIIEKNKDVKAIMPVNLFGLCANLPKIMEIANKYNLKVIEDSACGLGAYIQDKHSGTFGQVGCFSFHPRKAITTGEGGMLVTDNLEIAETVKVLRDHGASTSDLQRHFEKGGSLLPEFKIRGYNYRMTDIQGAIGVCQMQKLQTILKKRANIALKYTKVIEKEIPFLLPPYVPEGYIHGYQSYVCLFTAGESLESLNPKKVERLNKLRNKFMMKLEEKGISTRQGTHAVHSLTYYKQKYNLKEWDYPNSFIADRLSITLPLYAEMTEKEFEYVIENVKARWKEL